MVDPSVLDAIKNSVEQDPDNLYLRLHYAELLLDANQAQKALEQSTFVLAKQPDHEQALKIAAQASETVGDKIKAQSYNRLLESLGWGRAKGLIGEDTDLQPTPPPKGGPEKLRYDDHDDPIEDVDELAKFFELENPEITLDDVKGLEKVKRRIQTSFLGPMRNPDMRKLYGKSLRGGLLLYGPPGCGKTFLAKALAGELGAKFLAVDITDVVDMYIGESEKKMHAIFDLARRKSPCVLFFDEMDALGRKRSLTRDHSGRMLINQLLSELDGVKSDNEGLYVVAATNHPWDIDTAMRRPGRLDRTVLVLPPDVLARKAIFESQFVERPHEGLNFDILAKKTEGFSGADIVHLCDSAAEFALEHSIETGFTRPVGMGDFQKALGDVKPSVRSWFETAKNFALYANEGGLYDDLFEDLKRQKLI